jgi:hypothetical protein
MHISLAPHGDGDISHIIDALVAADGTGAQSHAVEMTAAATSHGARPLASLADAAHYLCLLHGRFPGVIDHAATRTTTTDSAARSWLLKTAEAFADERAYLTRVAVALGPMPSTHGQNNCETLVVQQRHALEMLAQSDRRGCAMGAAITLTLDWVAIRKLLDMAAIRVGLEPERCTLPERETTLDVARAISVDDTASRAVQFGARQLLGQHRGMWDVLRARAEIRAAQ